MTGPANAPRPPNIILSVLVLGGVDSLIALVAWCAIDFVVVRSPNYPRNLDEGDWLVFPFAALLLSANWFMAARLGVRRRTVAAVIALVPAAPLAFLLVVFLGIPFHLRIGGQL